MAYFVDGASIAVTPQLRRMLFMAVRKGELSAAART